jgi:hypothetical protein
MNELHEYIKKVMWYAEMEYGIPAVSVEDFERGEHSNLLMNEIFNFFSSNQPFQNCACSLVEYMKKLMNVNDN